ncbi:MAG: glycoside hydrolase family 2 protein [Lachnospiraceae bacterium]|nr:glycoside hydrolase family 2 protein [Lachnospiraceae bacterium]
MSQRYDINDDWLFSENYSDEMKELSYSDEGMIKVRIPHTVKETPFHYFDENIYQMESCYRRHLNIPAEWKGKRVRLTFDGAGHKAEVFINGEKAAEHWCGYTAFTIDLTDRIKFGEDNVVCVKLDSRENINTPPFGFVIDYMTYGGLYREVYLDVSEQVYIGDVFLRTEKKDGKVMLSSAVKTENLIFANITVRQYIAQDGGERRLIFEKALEKDADGFEADPGDVKLWSPDSPNMYTIITQLVDTETKAVYDEREDSFGFRIVEFRNDGLYINDKYFKIRGLNRHQSYPYVGYAMPDKMQRLDAQILKNELGVNAVRTSHYPQSHAFIDECDRLGLVVFTEIPGWQHIGNDEWKDRAVENVEDMIRQYRNHPSILIWGVRINESADDDEFYKRTNEAAHRLDPGRPTGGVRCIKDSNLLEDVYTYNDFVHEGTKEGCEPKKNVTSDMSKPYFISEYGGHMYPTKAFDDEEHRREHAIRHANVLDAVAGYRDILGSFGWCMFDYNTHKDFGSGDRICYHGVTDMFRNSKQAAAVYAAQQEDFPILEISSSMDIGEHPSSNRGLTWIYTNADSVKMFKNDVLLHEYKPSDSPYKNLKHGPILITDFVGDQLEQEEMSAGQRATVKEILNHAAVYGYNKLPTHIKMKALKCVTVYHMKWADAMNLFNKYVGDWGGSVKAYRFEAIKDGKVVATVTKDVVTKLHLEARADHTDLVETRTYDVAEVRLRMMDEYDNVVPFFDEPVLLKTEGPIEIVGPSIISLKGGMGGTYVRTTEGQGAATLKIQCTQGAQVKIPFTVTQHRSQKLD